MLLKFFSQYVKFCKFRFPEKLEGIRQGSWEALHVDDNAGIFIPRIICSLDRALALERIVPYTILATFAPGVARDFYYLRKHQSFPTPGMLLHIGYPIYI